MYLERGPQGTTPSSQDSEKKSPAQGISVNFFFHYFSCTSFNINYFLSLFVLSLRSDCIALTQQILSTEC